jgi:hypothetical protein
MIMNRRFGDAKEYTLYLKDTEMDESGLTLVVQGESDQVYHDIIEPRATQVLIFKGDSMTKISYSSEDFDKEVAPVYSTK